MIRSIDSLEPAIRQSLRGSWGIELRSLRRLDLGADLEAAVFQAEEVEGRSLFLKLRKGSGRELGIILPAVLKAAGINEVIPPIPTIGGELAQSMEEHALAVYPFVQGTNGFARSLSQDQWLALGKTLQKIHLIQLPESIYNQVPAETFDSPWRSRVAFLMQQAAQLEPSDAIGRIFQNFLVLNKHTIARLIESTDSMHQRLQPDPSDFVLCHTDLHAGNVLIDSSGRLFVIDWDTPMLAPKERDLMFIGGGVGNVWNQPLEVEKFFEGYGRTRIDRQMLAFYRFDRILEDIAIYIEILLVGSCEGLDRQQILQHFLDLFSPRGVVEIAFESEAVSNFD